MRKIYRLFTISIACSLALVSHADQMLTIDSVSANRGKELAILGDCQACHTYAAGNGAPFAGGYPIGSPIGEIYSSNITPSKEFGIGNYTLAQFTDVLRKGIRADGKHLYPAMPYTAYTKLTEQDIADLYAYFMHEVAPVNQPLMHQTDLPFPFNIRAVMIVWNTLFLDDAPYQDNPDKSSEWNRGGYIVQALAHCSTCHTPRDFMMAEKKNQFLGGGQVGAWYAPNITPSKNSGIGNWTQEEIITYLKTGHIVGKAQAAGPMAEAVEDSFQYVSDEDLIAITTYIQNIDAIDNPLQKAPRDSYGKAYDVDIDLRGEHLVTANNTLNDGVGLYSAYCSSCHQNTGAGTPDQFYPSLFNNTATGDFNPSNIIAAILNGVERTVDGKEYYMPSFGQNSPTQALTDEQIALITQFVYQKYGHPDVVITPTMVKEIRQGGAVPFLLTLQPYFLPATIIIALLILWGIIRLIRPKKR